jgi:hypothetical protein
MTAVELEGHTGEGAGAADAKGKGEGRDCRDYCETKRRGHCVLSVDYAV